MKRLDWQLVRPGRNEGGVGESLRLAQLIHRLLAREATDEEAESSREGDESQRDENEAVLVELEDRYFDDTVSSCEAVEAPTVEEDPDWEQRLVEEYGEADTDLELEDYLDLRRDEYDCDRCPYASPYSLYPMDPCEFSAGMLPRVLRDPDLRARAEQPMDPQAMRSYADALEEALHAGRWEAAEVVDVADYLDKAVLFLRFWAAKGFAVLPTDVDEVLDHPAEGPDEAPSRRSGRPDRRSTTYH